MTDYQENVRAAAAALKRGEEANWELARLTFENTAGPGGQRPPGKVTIAQWCADVMQTSGRGFSDKTARIYREVWSRFGNQLGTRVPNWSEAYAEVRGGTVGERMAAADFNRAIVNASPEQKRQAFASLAREPEVLADLPTSTEVFSQIVRDNPAAVQEAWKNTQTNIGLSTARVEAREELHEPLHQAIRETEDVFEPKDSTLDRRIFLGNVATKVEQWTRELNDIRDFLEFSDDVDRIRRWATRQALDRLVQAASACRDALPSSYVEEPTDDAVTPVTAGQRRRLA